MLSVNEELCSKNIESLGWKSGESAAFLSLRTALQAYFESYRATYEGFPDPLKFDDSTLQSKFESDLYKTLYFTTITHFQNFFELILKDFLRKIDELLAVKWNEKFTTYLYRKIKSKELCSNVFCQSIEFSEALKRLKIIQKENPKDDVIKKIEFLLVKENDETLDFLNDLRNRIWHRGLYYLFYSNFDCFVCGKILPLVKQITDLDWYTKNKEWTYKNLKCGVDPIKSLISETSKHPINYEKIALLKEMGRAAYHNPIIYLDNNCSPLERGLKVNCNREKMKYVNVKIAAIRNELLSEVYVCPVCGQNTFLKYELDDTSFDENDRYPHYIPEKLKCETCSFEIRSNIEDLSLCGINCENFWSDHD